MLPVARAAPSEVTAGSLGDGRTTARSRAQSQKTRGSVAAMERPYALPCSISMPRPGRGATTDRHKGRAPSHGTGAGTRTAASSKFPVSGLRRGTNSKHLWRRCQPPVKERLSCNNCEKPSYSNGQNRNRCHDARWPGALRRLRHIADRFVRQTERSFLPIIPHRRRFHAFPADICRHADLGGRRSRGRFGCAAGAIIAASRIARTVHNAPDRRRRAASRYTNRRALAVPAGRWQLDMFDDAG